MALLGILVGVALILIVLLDAFEAMVLPRRVQRAWRPARLFYRTIWTAWRLVAAWMGPGKRRDYFLSVFGPLSILLLIGSWVVVLIVAFGVLHWSAGTLLAPADAAGDLPTNLYFSGVTFFTLGYGDVTAREPWGRLLSVVECGVGFGFLAVIIGYLPVLYGAFSRREVTISLLDARAGSPPTAAEVLLRLARSENLPAINPFLAEWEHWAGEVLESHLSFPVLPFYRSQHDNQSWLAAMTAVLDTCSLLITGVQDCSYQARLTFAMARHTLVDLCMVYSTPPVPPEPDRLLPERLTRLRELLAEAGLKLNPSEAAEARLVELRAMYEPFANALARFFLLPLPPVLSDKPPIDNWQTSAWMRRVAGLSKLALSNIEDDHND
jgi:hypothetical protein